MSSFVIRASRWLFRLAHWVPHHRAAASLSAALLSALILAVAPYTHYGLIWPAGLVVALISCLLTLTLRRRFFTNRNYDSLWANLKHTAHTWKVMLSFKTADYRLLIVPVSVLLIFIAEYFISDVNYFSLLWQRDPKTIADVWTFCRVVSSMYVQFGALGIMVGINILVLAMPRKNTDLRSR